MRGIYGDLALPNITQHNDLTGHLTMFCGRFGYKDRMDHPTDEKDSGGPQASP